MRRNSTDYGIPLFMEPKVWLFQLYAAKSAINNNFSSDGRSLCSMHGREDTPAQGGRDPARSPQVERIHRWKAHLDGKGRNIESKRLKMWLLEGLLCVLRPFSLGIFCFSSVKCDGFRGTFVLPRRHDIRNDEVFSQSQGGYIMCSRA